MAGDIEGRAARAACPRADTVGRADARDAVRALRLALHAARITLPDLHTDARDACDACDPLATGPLVELGTVHPDVALELAELISEGALHAAGARRPGPPTTRPSH